MKKKLFLLTVALLCAVVQGAWAKDQIKYIERSWDGSKVVETEKTITDYTLLEGDHSEDWMHTTGFYVVKGDVKYKTLNVYGDAHIILCDGATLTCYGGILVEKEHDNARLFIYSQSSGDHQGKLIVTNSYDETAGIGSSDYQDRGEICIHGGNLDVTGGKWGAGIGSGSGVADSGYDSATGAKTTIYGGIVKAQGGELGAGIGGGAVSDGGTYVQYGGEVTAIGAELAAGVGGGGSQHYILPHYISYNGGSAGMVHVYGGSLTATGGNRGAGIGTGNRKLIKDESKRGELWVYAGATVVATGGNYAAGIGGGCKVQGITVHICGGNVKAYGGEDAAGIGGGENVDAGNLDNGKVYISGGTVLAKGKSYGAGIGGGEDGFGADVYITGGSVTAIAGKDCECRKWKNGSAIGIGDKSDHISLAYPKDNDKTGGKLEIADNMRVTGGDGDAEDEIERVFTSSERIGACRWRNYVKIEPCQHLIPTVGSDHTAAVTYTIDSDTHTKHCRYCAYTQQEAHTFVDNVCSVCLKYEDTSDDLWSVTLYRASSANSTDYDNANSVVMKVVKGQTFTVPAVSATEGLTLMGYATSPVGLSSIIEMKDNETTLTAVGEVVTPTADMSLYPRYRYRYVPTWTWDDTDATATLSIVCSALSSEAVSVTNISYTTEGEVKTATGTYDHDGATYTFTDTYLLPVGSVALLDNASNEETLDNYKGRKVKALMLSGRTLYADGSWNTLCLPFALSLDEIYTNFGSCTLKTLESSSFANGVLTLNFTDATTIEAGKPYLIKWDSSDSDRKNPMFNYVTINDAYEAVTTEYVDFCGSFSPVTLKANDRSVLYLGADNKLYYPSADMTVGSCRAVFRLKDITAGDLASGANARRFVLNFGDGDETTGIISIDNGQLIIDNSMDAWYTLDGRRLTGKPTAKGVYINNGRKVVIK